MVAVETVVAVETDSGGGGGGDIGGGGGDSSCGGGGGGGGGGRIYRTRESQAMSNFLQNPPDVVAWLALDAPRVTEALAPRRWASRWGALKVVDSLLRGVAQVVFVNNPFSGLLVLLGLLLADVTVACAAVACALVAIFVAKALLALPNSQLGAGLPVFSAVLVGSVTASLYPISFSTALTATTWGYMVLAAVLSVYMFAGLGHILGGHDLPAYTLPFNIATSLIFLGMKGAGYGAPPTSASPDPATTPYTVMPDTGVNATGGLDPLSAVPVGDFEQVEWDQVWLGVLLSAGQVWAVQSVACSVLVLLAMLLCSPLLTAVCCIGSVVGTLTALVVSQPPYDSVYEGVWGYNGFLASGAMIYFVVATPRVVALAVVNAVLATFTHAALTPVFSQNNVPVFTFPFCLSSLVLLAAASSSVSFTRVSSLSFPEMHLLRYRQESATTENTEGGKEEAPPAPEA